MMIIEAKQFTVRGLEYIIRSAVEQDAKKLSEVRLQIDGETENMDRERGEAFIDEQGFREIIKTDSEAGHNLFLVAEVNGEIAGFSRCAGNNLKRSAHKVEFGVGVLEQFWGFGIGKKLLEQSIHWADTNGIKKIWLQVLEMNEKAAELYKRYGFEVEGVLKKDKLLSDGKFYNTIVMGRFKA
jgi:RimJ/RimL family protein N-acetyltransferase